MERQGFWQRNPIHLPLCQLSNPGPLSGCNAPRAFAFEALSNYPLDTEFLIEVVGATYTTVAPGSWISMLDSRRLGVQKSYHSRS